MQTYVPLYCKICTSSYEVDQQQLTLSQCNIGYDEHCSDICQHIILYNYNISHLTTECTAPNVDCKCAFQGNDACTDVVNSQCDTTSGECRCVDSVLIDGQCSTGVSTDGSQIPPFTVHPAGDWTILTEADIPANGMAANQRILKSGGQVCNFVDLDPDLGLSIIYHTK